MSFSDLASWYIPGAVIIAGFGVLTRWLVSLSRRVRQHGERLAYLEARSNITRADGED